MKKWEIIKNTMFDFSEWKIGKYWKRYALFFISIVVFTYIGHWLLGYWMSGIYFGLGMTIFIEVSVIAFMRRFVWKKNLTRH